MRSELKSEYSLYETMISTFDVQGDQDRSMIFETHKTCGEGGGVAVSCGCDTWFAVGLVMDYTISHFTWSILGYLTDPSRSSQP